MKPSVRNSRYCQEGKQLTAVLGRDGHNRVLVSGFNVNLERAVFRDPWMPDSKRWKASALITRETRAHHSLTRVPCTFSLRLAQVGGVLPALGNVGGFS